MLDDTRTRIESRAELPKNATGKILERLLREQAVATMPAR